MRSFTPERIKEVRIKRELSQRELGNAIGVTGVTISRWENGTRIPGADKIVILANILDVKIKYFYPKK